MGMIPGNQQGAINQFQSMNKQEQAEKIITIPLGNSYYQFDIYYKYKNGFLDGIKDSLNFIYT